MPNDYDIGVGFDVDLSGLTQGFEQAKAKARGLEAQMKQAGSKIGSSFMSGTGSISSMALSFNMVTGAAKQAYQTIAQVAGKMVELAKISDSAEQSAAYFDDVMGSLSEKGRDWAAGLADSYGLYTADVESYMASLAEAFHRAGNSMSDSYRMAQDFTQMSWDMSAYFPNYSLDEIQDMLLDLARGGGESALEKLASGMDGEALKAHAVAMGIAEIGEELSVLQKQKAAYDIIMGEHGDLMGLYGDADNATTALDRMNNSLTDLKETLGEVVGPVVEAFAKLIKEMFDEINAYIEDLQAKWDKMVKSVRNGVNWLSTHLGFGEVWTSNSEGAENAVVSTSKLEAALASLDKTAQATKATMDGLAGFDRLYTVKDTGNKSTVKETFGDWETAVDQWLAMFLTMPDEAIDKMDPVWDSMLDANVENIDQFREMFGDYFDWIAESELANSEYTTEQKQDIVDDLIEYMYAANQDYQDRLLKIEQEYKDEIDAYEKGQTDKTLEEIEAKRETDIANLRDLYETNMTNAFVKVLGEFKIATDEEVAAMQKAFDEKVAEIEKSYDDVFSYLKEQLDILNAKIASARQEAKKNSKPSGFWDNVKAEIKDPNGNEFWKNLEVGDGVGFFAEGGLFQPNNPQLVVMGDNTVEPEVAAPRSMIEDAVQNVINRNGGLAQSGTGVIEVPVTITLDGKTLAKAQYKYLVQESKRRGNPAGLA